MGVSFEEFFKDAGAKAQEQIDSLVKVGVPALQASAEQWGIDVLTDMQKEHSKDLSAAIKEVTKNDPAPGSFGAAFNATIKGSILETQGTTILIAVIGLICLGLFLRGK